MSSSELHPVVFFRLSCPSVPLAEQFLHFGCDKEMRVARSQPNDKPFRPDNQYLPDAIDLHDIQYSRRVSSLILFSFAVSFRFLAPPPPPTYTKSLFRLPFASSRGTIFSSPPPFLSDGPEWVEPLDSAPLLAPPRILAAQAPPLRPARWAVRGGAEMFRVRACVFACVRLQKSIGYRSVPILCVLVFLNCWNILCLFIHKIFIFLGGGE